LSDGGTAFIIVHPFSRFDFIKVRDEDRQYHAIRRDLIDIPSTEWLRSPGKFGNFGREFRQW
jgi:hypothetical protein